ncbi:MAG: dihydropteroate synthase-like protein [Candidatus Hermodarchaeota archaeon]
MNILLITGQASYPIIKNIVNTIKNHEIKIELAPVSISAFLTEKITQEILDKKELSGFDLVLIPGFVQWNTINLEDKYSIKIKKGPEFASDLPMVIEKVDNMQLSNQIPANKLFEVSGEKEYDEIVKGQYKQAKNNLGNHTFYINESKSDIMIGRNLPPPIIAEIVNCTEKNEDTIIKKAKHYIESGADIIDIGCVANKPNPERVKRIINLLRNEFEVLLSIDSMDTSEINSAIDEGIDMILSFDLGNHNNFLNIDKEIPIVLLPTNIKEAYFPREPELRVNNLFQLTEKLQKIGFKKLIADPLLETPISPGICNSLDTYFLYKKKIAEKKNSKLELPLFFGISNVVELMDIDSVGINGLLASIAIEMDMGILFTVEHSTKLMGGVAELKKSIKLNYLSKHRKTPPINQGISIFKAKGKTSSITPEIRNKNPIIVEKLNHEYIPDDKGYFKIYINHYEKNIKLLHYSNDHEILNLIIGKSAEALSKRIIKLKLTENVYHINYLGRELSKAEYCLTSGKPYIQDEKFIF